MGRKVLITTSIVIALVIILGSLLVKSRIKEEPEVVNKIPVVGEAGSDHTHMSMIVSIGDQVIDFSLPEYQLQSQLVHFEDGNGTFVHKHATGVTLPFLFNTLGMELTENCFTTRDEKKYCTQGTSTLSIFINRTLVNDYVERYELRNKDKILINYGDDSDFEIEMKLNAIPEISPEL